MKIEFKEIDLKDLDLYNPSSYPSKGFYLAETDITEYKNMIYNDGVGVMLITSLTPTDILSIKDTNNKNTNVNDSVSEELFLATLSLVLNKL